VIFTDEESGLYSESSFSFTLKLYPTEVFMATYRTDNPMWGAIICVVIISFTAIVFGVYDHNVRGEFTFKNELLEAKRNFTRFLSHEVRTPLNSIYMGMVLMREELEKAMRDSKKVSSSVSDNNNGKSPPVSHHRLSEWKGMADDILENSQNAVDVLNDLLNYDKITTGSLKLELSLLEIDILKDHAQKGFKLTAAKKQIDVLFEDNASLRYTKNNLCIVGDNSRLIQVIRNLMSNALKFTPPKGRHWRYVCGYVCAL
jgi:signal transduction histidine kinase